VPIAASKTGMTIDHGFGSCVIAATTRDELRNAANPFVAAAFFAGTDIFASGVYRKTETVPAF
jgi:hypothetical protein